MGAVNDALAGSRQYKSIGTTDAADSTMHTTSTKPMIFFGEGDNLSLSCRTDPILGFHLATAYAPLADSSPLNPNQAESLGLNSAVEAPRQQFWCSAFRSRSRHFVLRFFVGKL
ncbi:hypothetical protein MPH_07933 [Macrophomina phaseolina MS6]|uniref:Uncharacterized protein n=1 Tax=Macrophomina phaseolina (strain MS6) TaxID=1126212 RepID=K2RJR3_MACPH|nr:hypothetical protein MPH_07933 [Macrophomina phaseolina MS6]